MYFSSAHFDLIIHEMLHLQYIGFHAGDDIITVPSYIFTKSSRRNAQQRKNTEMIYVTSKGFSEGQKLTSYKLALVNTLLFNPVMPV